MFVLAQAEPTLDNAVEAAGVPVHGGGTVKLIK
jgi:hypothetical protein